MATKEKNTNTELEVEEIVSRSEQFIENNSKKIIYGIIAIALVVGVSSTNMEVLLPATWQRLMQVSVISRWEKLKKLLTN